MRFRNLLTKFTPLAIAALVGFSGCSSDLSAPVEVLSDTNSLAWQNQIIQEETPALLAGLDIEGAYEQGIIENAVYGQDGTYAKPSGAKKKALNFAETNEDEVETTFGRRGQWLVKAQVVSPDESTVIVFGSDKVGYSTIEFPEDAVEEDVVVTVVHKLKGKRDFFLFPEGIEFQEDVTVRFSLAGLNQRQKKKLMNLRLWHHIPDQGWVLVPSYSDGSFVIATLEHFSRYAVGSDE
jgi:hypothetical protein